MSSRFFLISLRLVALAMTASLLGSLAFAGSCVRIGDSLFCNGRGAHNTIGRSVIFNTGPAGARVGPFISIPDGDKSRLTGTGPDSPIVQDRPAKSAADRLHQIPDGRGFGAYVVPRAPRFDALPRRGAN